MVPQGVWLHGWLHHNAVDRKLIPIDRVVMPETMEPAVGLEPTTSCLQISWSISRPHGSRGVLLLTLARHLSITRYAWSRERSCVGWPWRVWELIAWRNRDLHNPGISSTTRDQDRATPHKRPFTRNGFNDHFRELQHACRTAGAVQRRYPRSPRARRCAASHSASVAVRSGAGGSC